MVVVEVEEERLSRRPFTQLLIPDRRPGEDSAGSSGGREENGDP